ncbi:DNA topology modulation protein [Exiguobacterium algae]|uniref:DNA topology modulation protein n=1 Tax=Exiguobacterium algae TaxID=2751250 RepID=UPI001BE9852F|nr:DNA topology modulation protein [Exiguobacterium algae]
MKKIIIIGSGGSGKSTFARKLGGCLQLNVYHLDHLLWQPGWKQVPRSEQIRIQEEILKQEKWILDGNYNGTLDLRIDAADTIIFLDLPRILCTYRVGKRMIRYYGKTRPDMGEDCIERFDFQFLKWVWNYKHTQRPHILDKLQQHSHLKDIYILNSRQDVKQFLYAIQLKG